MKKVTTIVLALVSIAGTASAQETPPPHGMGMCKTQIELYCPTERDQKDLRGVLKCLAKNDDRLSTECKQEAQRFAQASRQTRPPSGGPMASLGGLAGPGAQLTSLSYEGRFVPKNDGNPGSPSITENSLNVSVPVYKAGSDTVALTLNGASLHFGESLSLSSGTRVASDFYRTEAGFQYSHRFEGRKTFGVRGSFGYAGDKLDSNTRSVTLNANYSFPGSGESQWVLLVMMSNTGPFGNLIPVPGFFYVYRTPEFTGIFGFPILSLQWTPVNPWAFSFSAFGPVIRTEVAYGAVDATQFFSAFGWKQQRYMLSERATEEDRFTAEEKVAELGLRRPLFHVFSLEAQAGYSFDRSIYIGDGLFNKDRGERSLGANAFVKWGLKVAF